MEHNFHIDLLINSKHKTKDIIKDIYHLLTEHKVNIDITNDNFDDTLNSFLLSYVKLLKFIERDKDDIKNRDTVDTLIDDIINKSENNIVLVPKLESKKIEIKNKCEQSKTNNNVNIVMKN